MFSFFRQSAISSLASLFANKGRSFLTMLGIIIGVAAVIIIMAVGAGAQSLILAQFKSIGSDLIGILPGKSEEKGPPTSVMGIVITTLKEKDLEALKKKTNVPNLVEAAGYVKGSLTTSWGPNTYDTNLTGVSANFSAIEGGEVEKGRLFTENEDRSVAKVAILGNKVAEELFGESDPIGRRIKIKKTNFEVIGVMKKRGTVAFQNFDDQVYVPLSSAQKLILGIDYLNYIRVKIDDENNLDRAVADIKTTLRERHEISDKSGASDDFTVRSLSEMLDTITGITDSLKYFLAAMAAISLIVGGIGIMNIMLIRITERTREIGLRKAVGATNSNILLQFLIESIVVTLVGGILGIAFGSAVAYLIAIGAKLLGYQWDFVVSFFSIFLAVSVSMAVGLTFGLYPARKAGKFDPIEALRYE